MRKLDHVRPSSVEVAWYVVMLWLFGSARRSSQIAWNVPCWSTAIHGKNWLFAASVWFGLTLTGTGFDQVDPLSRERLTSMSPLPRPRV